MDIEPIKLKPTWHNNRCGDGRVAKRLDRFLISEKMLDHQQYMSQWVGCGGRSDHLPIFLEYRNGPIKPTSPLKFNKIWLKDASFRQLIHINWVPFNPENRLSTAYKFADIFSQIKRFIKSWAVDKYSKEDLELRQIEQEISATMDLEGGGMLNQETKDSLVRLQGRRNIILLDKEETWRLKSRAIWLECGDGN